MHNLLTAIKSFLEENCNAETVEIIDDVDMLSKEATFPAIGILDGGFDTKEGASESLRTFKVSLAFYQDYIGEAETAIIKTNEMAAECEAAICQDDNFYSGGVFGAFSGCTVKRGSKTFRMTLEGETAEDSFILLKVINAEFTRLISEV